MLNFGALIWYYVQIDHNHLKNYNHKVSKRAKKNVKDLPKISELDKLSKSKHKLTFCLNPVHWIVLCFYTIRTILFFCFLFLVKIEVFLRSQMKGRLVKQNSQKYRFTKIFIENFDSLFQKICIFLRRCSKTTSPREAVRTCFFKSQKQTVMMQSVRP